MFLKVWALFCWFSAIDTSFYIQPYFSVDVVKTRYVNAKPGEFSNALKTAVVVAKEGGFKGFYKGWVHNLVSDLEVDSFMENLILIIILFVNWKLRKPCAVS